MDHEMALAIGSGGQLPLRRPNCSEFPVVEGSQVPYLYYCDPLEAKDPLGNVVEPTTYVDIRDQLEEKAEMLACHVSQRQWLLDHHGIDEYLNAMPATPDAASRSALRPPRPSSSTAAIPILKTTF